MDEKELKQRTKRFAIDTVALVSELPRSLSGQVMGRQLLRAGTSVGANYRAACRARSKPDMASKMSIVEEEADESAYWLEIIAETGLLPIERVGHLHKEANEIVAIMVASLRTIRGQ